MNERLNALLLPDEKLLCPIYCAFKPTGFFASPSVVWPGFAGCTSRGRIVTVQFRLADDRVEGACLLSTVKKLKIKKILLGQYKIEAVFGGERDIALKMQAAPYSGKNFPEQKQNLETMLSILKQYEKK